MAFFIKTTREMELHGKEIKQKTKREHFCSLFYDNNSFGTCSIETPTFAHSINPITECW